MSKIEVTVGEATAEIRAEADVTNPQGTFPVFVARDLMDATAAALLAINTPQSKSWADQLYRITGQA